MTISSKLAAAPALGLAAMALVLGVSAVASGSIVNPLAEVPRAADASLVASEGLSPVTTARDWTEVAGTKTVITSR